MTSTRQRPVAYIPAHLHRCHTDYMPRSNSSLQVFIEFSHRRLACTCLPPLYLNATRLERVGILRYVLNTYPHLLIPFYSFPDPREIRSRLCLVCRYDRVSHRCCYARASAMRALYPNEITYRDIPFPIFVNPERPITKAARQIQKVWRPFFVSTKYHANESLFPPAKP